jgi:DNA repair exonuclease SbcCD ATPase subunit
MVETLNQYKNKIQRAKGQAEYIRQGILDASESIESKTKYLHSLEQAQLFLQKVAQDTQNQLRFHIRDIVQLCLDAIWPGEVLFDVVFEIKRGKTEARLVFMVDDEEVDPLDADGGGLVQVAAFALRIAVWTLGKTRNTIVLDEPMNALSSDSQPLAAEIVKELSDKLGIQFIIVTHQSELTGIADKIFKVKRVRSDQNYWISEVTCQTQS